MTEGIIRQATRAAPVVALLMAASAWPSAAADLDGLLRSMDSAAAAWRGMRADVEWSRYMSLVDDRTSEFGRIVVRRDRSGGVSMLISFERPNAYFLSVKGAKVEIYKPKTKTVEEYDLSDSRAKLENALLLGFGISGAYLGRHFDIKVVGGEDIGGYETLHIDLQPKAPDAELNNQRIEMWISTTHWQPVRQKVHDRLTDDYRAYSYSRMEVNPALRDGEFRLRLARGTRRVRPQR